MCGVAGFLTFGPRDNTAMVRTAAGMAETIRHRGPDGHDVWVDADSGIALAHRRLSIIDVSPTGAQPMHSASGRYVISYNGEIYNFQELRVELEQSGCHFRGHSDTEVLLAAIDTWKLEVAIKRFVGMFAFALWDKEQRRLHLVRDRLGEKPLYYGLVDDVLLFGSELKALRAHPRWYGEIDRDSVALQMRYGYIPAPYSVFKKIYKLPPASILTVPAELSALRKSFSPHADGETAVGVAPRLYWSAYEVAEAGIKSPLKMDEHEVISAMDAMLRDTVRAQMIADVPLGAFLSGGIDSSTVVALMQAQHASPVKTFTVGFTEKAHDEAPYASAVARYLGTDHTELYVTPKQAIEVIPDLPELYDEPFSDSSQIPTFLISRLAREHVTVCLSGDAGDELFAGYNRYLWTRRVWQSVGWLPMWSRRLAAKGIRVITPDRWESIYRYMEPLIPRRARQRLVGDKLYKLADVLARETPMDMYLCLLSNWSEPDRLVLQSKSRTVGAEAVSHWSNVIHQMLYWDLDLYLPNDNLVKVDRASMRVSLETRLPYLDHRMVEFAWRIPLSMKIRHGQGKWVLRELLSHYLPKDLFERPKTGFSVPIGEWLRSTLRDWSEDLLSEKKLSESNIFNTALVRKIWRAHLNGERNYQSRLWDVLMFQAWHAGMGTLHQDD